MENSPSIDPLPSLRVELAAARLRQARRRGALKSWAVPLVLFVATVLSTLYVGGVAQVSPAEASAPGHILRAGVPFALTLLAILLSHEFGHYFTARAHGVSASLPYFIPFPSLTGTLGAVIRMRGSMPNRRALIDIGASGPIAGFVVAVPFLFLGLSLSHLEPMTLSPHLFSPLGWLLDWRHGAGGDFSGIQEGPCLLYVLAKRIVFGRVAPGMDVALHPVGFAAWFGLLVTMLNLLPVGQLDGGHVLYALLGERARTVGRVVVGLLVVLGLTAWAGWLLWALLGWKVIKTTHPPVDDPELALGPVRRAIAWIALGMLVLSFMPVPLATL